MKQEGLNIRKLCYLTAEGEEKEKLERELTSLLLKAGILVLGVRTILGFA